MKTKDYRMTALQAPPTTEHRAALTRKRRFRISFYSKSSEPSQLPPFAYAVSGTVLGHTKFIAYLHTYDEAEAQYQVRDSFDVEQVECIDYNWDGIDPETLRGTITDVRPKGFFSRLFSGW